MRNAPQSFTFQHLEFCRCAAKNRNDLGKDVFIFKAVLKRQIKLSKWMVCCRFDFRHSHKEMIQGPLFVCHWTIAAQFPRNRIVSKCVEFACCPVGMSGNADYTTTRVCGRESESMIVNALNLDGGCNKGGCKPHTCFQGSLSNQKKR